MLQDQITVPQGNAAAIDERRERRRKVLKGGTIRFNGGYGAMQCLVRNLSEGGAMLEFGETLGVPVHFDLAIDGTNGSRPARLRWRSERMAGIEFTA